MPRVITPAVIADFRNHLCEVAAELFVELGHDGFNMRELAKRLRVSPMTAYRYFKNKDDILAALRTRAFARFADRLEIAHKMSNSPEDKNDVMGRAFVQFALEEPASYRLMFDLFQSSAHTPPELAQQESRAHAAMTEHARYLVREGIFAGEPELIGQVLWSALHGVAALRMAGKLSDTDFDRVLSETLRALANAFRGGFTRQTSPAGQWRTLKMHESPTLTSNYTGMAVLSAAE